MRYIGGKFYLSKHILPFILERRSIGQYYIEPFAGGFNCIDKVKGKRIANDINPFVIAYFKEIQSGWLPPKNVTEQEYKDAKTVCKTLDIEKTDRKTLAHYAAIGFGCSFNSIWFTSFAKNKKTKRNHAKEFYYAAVKQQQLIQGVEIHNVSYEKLHIPKKSIIYCDPPYRNTYCPYSVEFNHSKFYDWCREKKAEGHTVFVSEFQMPDDFDCVFQKEKYLTMNNKNSKTVIEKLFTVGRLEKYQRELF